VDARHQHGLPAHLRRVQALLAGGASQRDGLVEDLDELERFTRIIDAWDDSMRPMTRAEVAEAAGLTADSAFEHRFEVLAHYGAVIQHRLKAGTIKWTPSPVALISAQIMTDLAGESAADRLADLIVLALDRVDDPELAREELVGIALRLTRVLNVVSASINRAVDLGTLQELFDAAPSPRAQKQVGVVAEVVEVAHQRFPDLTLKLRELIEAADAFGHATDRLGQRLSEQATIGGAGGLFALLDPADVDRAARQRGPAELRQLARDVVFDHPQPVVTRHGLLEAADEIGEPPRVRSLPPVPDRASGDEPVQLLHRQRDQAERRDQARRRWVLAALAGTDEAVITDDVWPAPVQRLVDGLAVATDPTVPVNCDLATHQHVEPTARVAVNTPLRLRRLGVAAPADDTATVTGGEPA
jgi:hypothetical protein